MTSQQGNRIVNRSQIARGTFQAAAAMGVSRQTVGRVLERGRAKVAEALVTGKAILIGGGQYRVEPRRLCCRACGTFWMADSEDAPPAACPTRTTGSPSAPQMPSAPTRPTRAISPPGSSAARAS